MIIIDIRDPRYSLGISNHLDVVGITLEKYAMFSSNGEVWIGQKGLEMLSQHITCLLKEFEADESKANSSPTSR